MSRNAPSRKNNKYNNVGRFNFVTGFVTLPSLTRGARSQFVNDTFLKFVNTKEACLRLDERDNAVISGTHGEELKTPQIASNLEKNTQEGSDPQWQ